MDVLLTGQPDRTTANYGGKVMLKILDDESKIRKAQRRFVKRFKQFMGEEITVTIGYPGGHEKGKVSWIGKLGIWIYSKLIPRSRYWNAFGIGKPKEDSMNHIVCEINFPLADINRSIGGVFVEDGFGNIFVVHRGKIGGGRKGIGKSLFKENYRGEWISIEDGEIESTVALIGALNSSRFAKQTSQFVREVERIKGLVVSRPLPMVTLHNDHEFRAEFAGKKKYETTRNIKAECDHGLIVNALASVLQNRGIKVGNKRNLDLYVVNSRGKITSIFEIKTDIAPASLYSAIGQLLLSSVSLPRRPRLILAIPEKAGKTLGVKLNKLGIELLVFRWNGDKTVFTNLNLLNL